MVSEPQSTNIAFLYERQAMRGEEMPEGLDYPDKLVFLCFRTLYAQLRQGIIDRTTGICEKRKIMREYEARKLTEQVGQKWVRLIRETELARSEYRKNRTLENADKLLFAIDGGNYGKQEE